MSSNSQSRRRREYLEAHWEEHNLSTTEMSTQPELRYQQQQLKESTKKKKSRGNRKLQRLRAKLKKRGSDEQAIATMINEHHNVPRQVNKEKEGSDVNVSDFVER